MKKILAGTLVVSLALAANAVAQPPEGGPPDGPPRFDGPPGPMGPPIMMALDADKDGVLSADEIAKAPEALKTLDKDGDGKLTAEELRPPRAPRGPGDRPRDPREDGPPDFERRPRDGGPGDGPPEGGRGRRRDRPEGRGPRDFGPPDGPPDGPPPGDRGPRRRPRDGDEARGPRVLPPGAREELDLSDEQIEKIDALEQEVKTKIAEILKPEQLERLADMFRRRPGGPGGFGGPPGPPDGPPGPPDRPRGPRPPRD